MVNIKVCFIDNIPINVQEYIKAKLKNFSNIQINFQGGEQKGSIPKNVLDADILVGWHPTQALLKRAEKMRMFINPGAGVRHLIQIFNDVNQNRLVYLINGHGNSYFVAQHAVALLLSLMNKIILHHQWMKVGKWRTGDKEGASIPLRFKKVGLFGYGAINQKIHRMLSGFSIDFSIIRKNWYKQKKPLLTEVQKFEFNQLHEFLENIDILIIAVPVTSSTEGIIKLKELELLGPQGLLVNVSRGEIIDERSLYYALKHQVITGAAIDVWYVKDPKKDKEGKKYPYNFPFHELENIVLSPHRGYSPFNDLLRWNEVIENITRMADGRDDFINVVDLKEEY